MKPSNYSAARGPEIASDRQRPVPPAKGSHSLSKGSIEKDDFAVQWRNILPEGGQVCANGWWSVTIRVCGLLGHGLPHQLEESRGSGGEVQFHEELTQGFDWVSGITLAGAWPWFCSAFRNDLDSGPGR